MYPLLLRGLEPEARKAAMSALPPVVLEDFAAASEASKRYRIEWFQRSSWRVYDKYLQAQGIEEGVKNYDRGITLFAQLWREGGADYNGMEGPPRPEAVDTGEAAEASETGGVEVLEQVPDAEVLETTELPPGNDDAPTTGTDAVGVSSAAV
jgi:hypothetical protein